MCPAQTSDLNPTVDLRAKQIPGPDHGDALEAEWTQIHTAMLQNIVERHPRRVGLIIITKRK